MNGCRELIALSSTTSNIDVSCGLGAFSAACTMPSSSNTNNIENSSIERPQSGGAISGSVVTLGSNNSPLPSQSLPQFSFGASNVINGPTSTNIAGIGTDASLSSADILSMSSFPLTKREEQATFKHGVRARHSNS